MASEVSRRGLLGNLLTWVPARSSDNRQRGYDHAEVLARALAGRLGLRAEPLLNRRGTAEDQTGLNKEERRRNLEHAFAPGGPCTQPVVLVDDVITTGATLAACARALRKAGVPRVEAVVACSAD
jgi:predicted amidophosphoribosyltransferase